MERQDIIVAPATPPGEGGVAIIRLSGSDSLDLVLPFFLPSLKFDKPESHFLYHGYFIDDSRSKIDEIMFVYMRAPRSFTAEDVVEIHCHGGQQTVSYILSILTLAGCRLARPGEFSYRAYMNGRIDLSQAEAIADLIHARTETSHTLAFSQMEGQLSRTLFKHTEAIKQSLALIEAWIDFPEEELPAEDMDQIRQSVEGTVSELQSMTDSYNSGRLYSEGVSLLLVGRPNVGKSSLMNALLGEERAIVTDIEGTTRDTLEEGMVIHGLPVRLVDTAGLRHSDDPIERKGVERARHKIDAADLILFLIDGSCTPSDEDYAAFELCSQHKMLKVINKKDIETDNIVPRELSDRAISISSKTGEGLDILRQRIYQELIGQTERNDNSVLLTNKRHFTAASSAIISLNRFIDSLQQGFSLEFLAIDLRETLDRLGDITGETTTDDVLDVVFSRFCIGK